MQLDNSLPHAPDAERSILGAILLDNRLLISVASALEPADFYVRAHLHVFAAMLELGDEVISPISLGERLRARNLLEHIGGISFISGLTYGMPHFSSVRHYVELVREKSALRRLLHLGSQIAARAAEADAEVAELAAWADETLQSISAARAAAGFRPAAAVGDDALLNYERMYRNDVLTIPTGFPELDAGLQPDGTALPHRALHGGGFALTDLVIVAGQASFGKTSFALDVAVSAARAGFPVGFASLEMADTSLFMRVHSAESGVERWKMRSGIYEPDFRRLVQTASQVAALPLFIADHVSSVDEFARRARELVRREGVRLLVVDYLQLLTSEGRRGSRNDEVGSIARRLKLLALELKTPVIALSQLSRDHAKAARDPELMDLRDSGEIEQHADTVIFLYGDRPEEGATFRDVKVKVAKQREGALFKTEMIYNGSVQSFRCPPAEAPSAYTAEQEASMLGTM
jgi:replicative DNA helicase